MSLYLITKPMNTQSKKRNKSYYTKLKSIIWKLLEESDDDQKPKFKSKDCKKTNKYQSWEEKISMT